MSRVRNADEFLLKFRKTRSRYEQLFEPRLRELRNAYAAAAGTEPATSIDEGLEAHSRAYFVNALLGALNWRLDVRPEQGLPNLVPQAPIRSQGTKRIRFLDYLGLERDTDHPLLIVETKRPSAPLPSSLAPAETHSELVSRGLAGEALNGEWNTWLDDLKDYVRSVHARTQRAPRRAVITNGDWLIVFLDPRDSFLEDGSCDPNRIVVFRGRNEMEERFAELFRQLEHQQVLGKTPALTPVQLLFHIHPGDVDRAMHGLHLRYIEQPGIYRTAPVIKVAPMILLRSRYEASFWVESFSDEYEIPHGEGDLPRHLAELKHAAEELPADVNRRLGTLFHPQPLLRHYDDEDGFAANPGVQERGSGEFLVTTGDKTHYLLPEPSVLGCPFHDWLACQGAGVAANPGPIAMRSTSPRSFFKSAERHHCAHRDVSAAKASPITNFNRARYGLRSGKEGQAFCEVWRFEHHLCCRACAFEEVCTNAEVFQLPCRRPNH